MLSGRRDGNRGATPNRGSVNVSCDPQVVNSHLAASQLVPGLVLNGTVTSIEEKGKESLHIRIESGGRVLPSPFYTASSYSKFAFLDESRLTYLDF